MKVIILNDTRSPKHAGCTLTMDTYKKELDAVGIEVLGSVPVGRTDLENYYEWFDEADLLISNGEGSIHHNNRMELVRIAHLYPTVLINAVWQSNGYISALDKLLYVSVRESVSKLAMETMGYKGKIHVTPDMVFASNMKKYIPKDFIGPYSCVRHTDSCLEKKPGDISIRQDPQAYVRELLYSGALVCGRFHGLILAAMLEKPFSAYSSNTHKNSAILADMDALELYAGTREEALKRLPEKCPNSVLQYKAEAPGKIRKMFEDIAEIKV